MDENITVYLPSFPWGFEIVTIPSDGTMPTGSTIIPPVGNSYKYINPVFNSDEQKWEEYDGTLDLKKLAMQQATQIVQLQKMLISHATDIAEVKKGSAE